MLGRLEKKCRLSWVVLVWIFVGSANLSSRAAVLVLDNTGGLTNGQVGTASNTKNISDKAWGYTFSVGNLNDNGVQSPYYGRLRGLGAMFCAGTDGGEGDYTVTQAVERCWQQFTHWISHCHGYMDPVFYFKINPSLFQP